MTQTISLDVKIVKDLVNTLRELKEEVIRLREKVELEPPYGSDEWWQWSDKKALKDIKEGRYTVLHNKKELRGFLDSLKTP